MKKKKQEAFKKIESIMVSKLAHDNYNKVTKAINDAYTTDSNQPTVKTYHQLQKTYLNLRPLSAWTTALTQQT